MATFGAMSVSTRIKQLIYPLYIFPKVMAPARKKLANLFDWYEKKALASEPASHQNHPVKRFSNLDEDGIILWIMATLGIRKGIFIDIGSNDCINSNCANLAFNFNWDGLFIDCEERLLKIGRRNYSFFSKNTGLRYACSFVSADNINQLISSNIREPDVDFVSIDIDGNDYAIFEALTIQPKCIVVENKIEYGGYDLVVPVNENGDEAGASIVAMTRLAEKKGYTLIAANERGFNTFYLRNDLVSKVLPALPVKNIIEDPAISKDFYPAEKMEKLSDGYAVQH